jgi:hypothetical protein
MLLASRDALRAHLVENDSDDDSSIPSVVVSASHGGIPLIRPSSRRPFTTVHGYGRVSPVSDAGFERTEGPTSGGQSRATTPLADSYAAAEQSQRPVAIGGVRGRQRLRVHPGGEIDVSLPDDWESVAVRGDDATNTSEIRVTRSRSTSPAPSLDELMGHSTLFHRGDHAGFQPVTSRPSSVAANQVCACIPISCLVFFPFTERHAGAG